MRSECPMNKEVKKDKDKKKKAMMTTWFNNDPSSFDNESKMKSRPIFAIWQKMMRYVQMTLMILILYKMNMNVYLETLRNLDISVRTTR